MRRRFAALTLLAALSVGMVACTAPAADEASPAPLAADQPGDEGQSTADACTLVQESIDSATEAFSSASADDPATAAEALRTAADELATVSSRVTNDEIAALLPPLQEMFVTASDALEAISSGDVTRLSEVGEFAGELQENVTRFQEICA